jgi:predicted nucleotidyltransferase
MAGGYISEVSEMELEFEKEIQSITTQLIEKYGPEKIILFGSAARGEYDQTNDLDFLIVKDDVPLYSIDRMRELDELIDRNVAADMLVYRPDELEDRIRGWVILLEGGNGSTIFQYH